MIEVEKKFALSEENIKKIEDTAEFVKEITNHDIYYDTKDYKLSKEDKWFRNRDGRFEIKIPIKNKNARRINIYKEVTDLEKISEYIGLKKLSEDEDFEKNLKLNGFQVLLDIKTLRKRFKIEGAIIDVDKTDYGYNVCEIEKMIESEDEVEKVTEEIFNLARSLGLEIKHVRGKGLEYFYRFNKKLYKIIEDLRLKYE